jgi:hypothetical protein
MVLLPLAPLKSMVWHVRRKDVQNGFPPELVTEPLQASGNPRPNHVVLASAFAFVFFLLSAGLSSACSFHGSSSSTGGDFIATFWRLIRHVVFSLPSVFMLPVPTFAARFLHTFSQNPLRGFWKT